ncbi:MAG TPA: hypothetical protein VI750_07900 [Pyrinomonadaceae bacterium]|nr:hypothetical protein [Pyrinomonadaceae bacterium]
MWLSRALHILLAAVFTAFVAYLGRVVLLFPLWAGAIAGALIYALILFELRARETSIEDKY